MILESWRVLKGHADGLDLHLERFSRGVQEFYGASVPEEVQAQARNVKEDSFPRLSFDGQRFDLQIRPLPALRSETVLMLPGVEDARQHPTLKGPDMAWQLETRERARAQGADEAVLVKDGLLIEASTSTLLLLEDNTLVRPIAARLPSITESLLLRRWPSSVTEREVRVDELATAQIFAVNSLHGVTRARLASL